MATDVITRENFMQMYPIVKEKILSCKFISIDEEMTGIMSPDWQQRNKKYDDPDGRYAKMVPVAKRYAIIQFGLCCWHDITLPNGEQGMEASPFTFYIFADNGPDVTLSSSSIAFLRWRRIHAFYSSSLPLLIPPLTTHIPRLITHPTSHPHPTPSSPSLFVLVGLAFECITPSHP